MHRFNGVSQLPFRALPHWRCSVAVLGSLSRPVGVCGIENPLITQTANSP